MPQLPHDAPTDEKPLAPHHARRDAVAVSCRPLEETRTAGNSCHWLAECEIDGQLFEARSRRDAPKELARALVAAGIPDRAIVVSYAGLRGTMSYRSFRVIADFTTVESASRPVHRGRFEHFDTEGRSEGSEGVNSAAASARKWPTPKFHGSLEGQPARRMDGPSGSADDDEPQTPAVEPKKCPTRMHGSGLLQTIRLHPQVGEVLLAGM